VVKETSTETRPLKELKMGGFLIENDFGYIYNDG